MLFILIYLIFLKVLHVLAIIWVLIWLLGIYCLYAILVLSMGFNVKKKKNLHKIYSSCKSAFLLSTKI